MKVEDLLTAVNEYREDLGVNLETMGIEEQQQYINDMALALQVETVEFLRETPWKPWRELKDQHADDDAAAEELIDILFFWSHLWAAIGKAPKEATEYFRDKLRTNYTRIDNGYHGDTSRP